MKGEDKMDSNAEELRLIILEYQQKHQLSSRAFAKKCGVSKDFIRKIELKKTGTNGVCRAYQAKLARGMGLTILELETLIANYYQKEEHILKSNKNAFLKQKIIGLIETTDMTDSQLEKLHSCIKNMK